MKALMMHSRKKFPLMLFLGSLLLLFGGDYLYNELLGVNDFLNGYYIFGLLFFGLVALIFLGKRALILPFTKRYFSNFFQFQKSKRLFRFIAMMLLFELIQMLMDSNNIFLMDMYFEFSSAHLYGSMAFVGKFLHIIAWTCILVFLPRIFRKVENGIRPKTILLRYVRAVLLFALAFTTASYFFPHTLSYIMYGDGYAMNAGLLGKYMLVVTLFIIAKMFTYYFLYQKRYLPAFLTISLGISQTVLIVLFHSSIVMVVHMQLIVMVTLVVAQLLYFAQNQNI
ncbi:hypothetical protein [Spongiimicrobium salis]|uniref:hypothetical protein n=1 Tax=Spongiimicrobium salis TaxID=1667022 RepID=UPI00374CFB18